MLFCLLCFVFSALGLESRASHARQVPTKLYQLFSKDILVFTRKSGTLSKHYFLFRQFYRLTRLRHKTK